MKAVLIRGFGGPEMLELRDVEPPALKPANVLVEVYATAVNRADVLQRKGLYPPPPGARPDLPGLEFCGAVREVGSDVQGFKAGDRVMGLLPGEGYAEVVSTPAALTLPVPRGFSWAEAAAVPEVFLTAFDALVLQLDLRPGERILIHAAASGVGTAAVQLARSLGAEVFGTAGSASKLELVRALGCHYPVNYHAEDFEHVVMTGTAGKGVEAIADLVGGAYWEKNLRCLSMRGRLILIGLLGGATAVSDLGLILRKRLQITGTVLRSRSVDEKAALVSRFRAEVPSSFDSGILRPVIDCVFPLEQAADAHRYMEENRNAGKIVLEVRQGCCSPISN